MRILLKNATILDPSSSFHSTTQDILIENGEISKIHHDIKINQDVKLIKHNKLI